MSIADRSILACWGVKGGLAGRSFSVVGRPGGPAEREVDALADSEPVRAGEVIRIRTTGGGGWGDPLERPTDEVVRDVRWGKVSFEGARPRLRRRALRHRGRAGGRRGRHRGRAGPACAGSAPGTSRSSTAARGTRGWPGAAPVPRSTGSERLSPSAAQPEQVGARCVDVRRGGRGGPRRRGGRRRPGRSGPGAVPRAGRPASRPARTAANRPRAAGRSPRRRRRAAGCPSSPSSAVRSARSGCEAASRATPVIVASRASSSSAGAASSSEGNGTPADGSRTTAPLPCRTSTRPRTSSATRARLRVARLTPRSLARRRSGGSRSPGDRPWASMKSAMWSASCSYSRGRVSRAGVAAPSPPTEPAAVTSAGY